MPRPRREPWTRQGQRDESLTTSPELENGLGHNRTLLIVRRTGVHYPHIVALQYCEEHVVRFPNLMSPFQIGSLEIRNRIFSTGHDTYLPEHGLPSDALIAYQVARARGGAGLIILQVVGVHETARYTEALLMGTDDDCIPAFTLLIDAIHAHGTKVFVQLFHPGRELLGRPEGVQQPSYAPSISPSERFRTAPRAMRP